MDNVYILIFQKVWGSFFCFLLTQKETMSSSNFITWSCIKWEKEGKIAVVKKSLISVLKRPQALNLYLWLRENVSLPMFCCSHWNLNTAVRLFHSKESLGCSYFKFCSHEKWMTPMEILILHGHWYIYYFQSEAEQHCKTKHRQVKLPSDFHEWVHYRLKNSL